MFKPYVTVANVVHFKGKFLIVEEIINNKSVWNQPAGHLEANETIFAAASYMRKPVLMHFPSN